MLKIFTIYDSKAEAYLQPFFMPTKGDAIRALTDLASDSNHNFGKHSADYTLFEVGSFDQTDGTFTLNAVKQNLGCLIEFKQK